MAESMLSLVLGQRKGRVVVETKSNQSTKSRQAGMPARKSSAAWWSAIKGQRGPWSKLRRLAKAAQAVRETRAPPARKSGRRRARRLRTTPGSPSTTSSAPSGARAPRRAPAVAVPRRDSRMWPRRAFVTVRPQGAEFRVLTTVFAQRVPNGSIFVRCAPDPFVLRHTACQALVAAAGERDAVRLQQVPPSAGAGSGDGEPDRPPALLPRVRQDLRVHVCAAYAHARRAVPRPVVK